MLAAGIALFGCFLFVVGVCDVAFVGGNSQAARFVGWVVNAIR